MKLQQKMQRKGTFATKKGTTHYYISAFYQIASGTFFSGECSLFCIFRLRLIEK